MKSNAHKGGVNWHSLPSLVAVLVALSVLLPPGELRAASGMAPEEMVCDVNADYALGIEDYPEAIRLHEKVLRQNPSNALAHYHLGFAYGMSEDRAGELREYLRAEQLGLRQWDLFLNLGIVYLENHDTDAAIGALTKAVKLGPRHAEAHFSLALAYEHAGLLPAARNEILASLTLQPNQPEARNTLGVLYAETGDYKSARAVWTDLVRAYPAYRPALENLAVLDRAAAGNGSEPRPSRVAASSHASR